MALRNIVTVEDDILRKKCKPVDKIDEKLLTLIKDMAETMYNTGNGAGLAAPQVGVLKRVVVIDVGEGLISLINPQIVEAEGSREVVEGCLSIPGKWGKLMRPERVKVTALNEKGEEIVICAQEDLAKALCHEIDHLDGILFIDKVTEYI